MAITVLKSACLPNRHGTIRIEKDGDTFFVTTPDDEDGVEFSTIDAAEAFLNEEIKRYAAIPNWELQAQYDEEHGTDNGYAPWQLNREY